MYLHIFHCTNTSCSHCTLYVSTASRIDVSISIIHFLATLYPYTYIPLSPSIFPQKYSTRLLPSFHLRYYHTYYSFIQHTDSWQNSGLSGRCLTLNDMLAPELREPPSPDNVEDRNVDASSPLWSTQFEEASLRVTTILALLDKAGRSCSSEKRLCAVL